MKLAMNSQGRVSMKFAQLMAVTALIWWAEPALAQSSLQSATSTMQPGEWRVLNRGSDASGFNSELLKSCNGTDCGDNILNYAAKGLWNPATREIHFIGKGHLRSARHIVYSEAANRWSEEPLPSWAGGMYGLAHGYEHTTIDPATGNIYARLFNSTATYRWSRSTKQWSQLPTGPNPAVAAAIEWFPEAGGFLLVGGGEVHLFSEATSSWRRLAAGLVMGGYHNVASYNPVHKVAIVGGGNDSRALYKVSSNGGVSRIADAPGAVGILSGVLTTDPGSGKVLLFTSSGTVHEYDIPSDRWSTLSSSIPLWAPDSNKIVFRVAVPISSYGSLAFLTHYWSDATSVVYLYKHSPGVGAPVDTTPPSPPSGVRLH
jgi:hypothetical protein